MKKLIRYSLLIAALCLGCLSTRAQQVGTMYFIETAPVRHYMNPAFQPSSGIYFGLPVLGYSKMSLGTNGLTLHALSLQKNRFFQSLKPTTLFNTEAHVNLIDFGFRSEDAYWSFAITQKVTGYTALPKDLFKFAMYGTPETHGNIYKLNKLSLGAQAYTELAAGYSRVLNDQWTVGAKIKALLGNAHISANFDRFDLEAGVDRWTLKGNGIVRTSSAANITIGNRIKDTKAAYEPNNFGDFLAGFGMGIDLGATYKPTEQLTLSAALLDLGGISWAKNTQHVAFAADHTIEGIDFGEPDYNNKAWGRVAIDTIGKRLVNAVTHTVGKRGYCSSINPKLNIGAEYAFMDNLFSLGILSHTVFQPKTVAHEFTVAGTLRPCDWFNVALSHSLLHGGFSSFGAGMGVRAGFINFFVNADYIPLHTGRINTTSGTVTKSSPAIPYRSDRYNINFGLNIVLGHHRDSDKDGVWNKFDRCPDTPLGVVVDEYGCPIDSDGDGVPDYLDRCPETPAEAHGMVDLDGCPLDSDGDGVPDYLDRCPDTPAEANKMVDEHGCLLDTDQDGVPDYRDKCPDTPLKADKMVDEHGCLLDTDLDGVPDYLDRCPDTPAEARATVDEHGCPKDTDGDSVPDYLDKCPDTPAEARGMVDEHGCPKDTDRDGVPDYLDNCPKIPGTKENKGCPEVKKEVRSLFQKAMHGIHFETGKAIIRKISYPILDKIATVLAENPTYLIEIQGHTDNVGSDELNQGLSERRAAAVRNYLINKGIEARRLTSNGYSFHKPIAPNTTAKGRALNRRVEFVVTFEAVRFEDVKFQ